MQDANDHFDVAVIGYGPTGATLALLLSQYNISTIIIEKEKDIYPLPRAVHFDDEIMRVFQNIGIATELKDYLHVNPGMRFLNRRGELLLDWPRPQHITEQGWNASYRFHQPDLERLLRKKVFEKKEIVAKTQCFATSINETDQGVKVKYYDSRMDREFFTTARYIVGCDGANSLVRTKLSNDMDDFGFQQRWLVVDVILKYDMPELGEHTLQYCHHERPMTYCRNPGLRRRWEIALREELPDSVVNDQSWLWHALSQWITPNTATIERTAVYKFRSLVAQTWQRGHFMIAGDAAHLMPPFMGQGMCAGIRDAANLGWKLACCIKNGHNEKLLASYQEERGPHVKEFITTAVKLGEFICSEFPLQDLSSLGTHKNKNDSMKSLSPALGQSDIFSEIERRDLGSGNLFIQPVMLDFRQMDDIFPYQFILISKEFIDSENYAVVLPENAQSIREILYKLKAYSILIRPDRYILTVCSTREQTTALLANFEVQQWFC